MQDLRFPVGRFAMPAAIDSGGRAAFIRQIGDAPERLREAVEGLTQEQLDTPYRPGGWTARQVVHHLPDSHANAYVRFRLALTEDLGLLPLDEALALYAWHGRHHLAHIAGLRGRNGWRRLGTRPGLVLPDAVSGSRPDTEDL